MIRLSLYFADLAGLLYAPQDRNWATGPCGAGPSRLARRTTASMSTTGLDVAEDIMNAVRNVAQMETFEGEYTLTDLIMKARYHMYHFGKSC